MPRHSSLLRLLAEKLDGQKHTAVFEKLPELIQARTGPEVRSPPRVGLLACERYGRYVSQRPRRSPSDDTVLVVSCWTPGNMACCSLANCPGRLTWQSILT